MVAHYWNTRALLEEMSMRSYQQQVCMLRVDIRNLRWMFKSGCLGDQVYLGTHAYYEAKDRIRKQHFLLYGNRLVYKFKWDY